MPLMGSLYIGASGLQTHQNALNTTAHNLSNVDTTGYVRQQVQLTGKPYITLSVDPKAVNNKQYGLGVNYTRVKQVRDYFLDKSFRKESGRSMFYEVNTEVLEEIEGQLGEMNGEAFQTTLSDLWTAVQELARDPASSVTQGMLVQRASEFIERAGAVYDGLSAYQDNLNARVKSEVNKINKYGQQLLVLNDKIRAIEAGGIEHANDLRDARNQILDELGKLTDMSYKEDINGDVSVQIEGVDFVKAGICYEIGLHEDTTTGFYTPFWPQNATYKLMPNGSKEYDPVGAEVFDLEREISTDLNTDIGGLKAILLARGDHRADYTDLARGGDYYDKKISQSLVMNVQAEFDQLIHSVATRMNEVLADAAGVVKGDLTLADGSTLQNVQYCKVDPDGYMRREDGSPIQLFSKIATAGYQKVTATDKDGNTGEYWVYNEEDLEVTDSLYTVKNLGIDIELMQKPSVLGFRKKDGSEDVETAEKLKDVFTEQSYKLNPNVEKRTTLGNYYKDLVFQVANTGYMSCSIYTNQVSTVESICSAREQVIGVSSDEELSNMVRFQNAYNASSRYINVISEMLEHIITTLGA